MQGKGIIKFFLILLIVISVVQYFFLIPTNKVEEDAVSYANQLVPGNKEVATISQAWKDAEVRYLDSMSSEKVFSIPLLKDYTYEELKSQQLALGLDLKGGMSMTLQVDLRELVEALAASRKNDVTLQAALDQADEDLKAAQTDYITLFSLAFAERAEGKTLASIFQRNESLRDDINMNTSDGEVTRILRQKANETVDLTFKRLKERIDELGVAQPNVTLDAARDLIVVELPGISNPERARKYMQATAKLEFWDVYRVSDPGIIGAFQQADRKLEGLLKGDTSQVNPNTRIDSSYQYTYDETGNISDSTLVTNEVKDNSLIAQGPLLSKLQLNGTNAESLSYPFSVMGVTSKNQKEIISSYLEKPSVKALFPKDILFLWSSKPTKDFETKVETNLYELYAIKKPRGSDKPRLEGDRVVDARQSLNSGNNEVVVSLSMDNQGAKIWGDITTKASQDNNREIAIALDDKVVSCPRVNEPILGGDTQISGSFSVTEAQDLANILQVGKLPAKTRIIQEALVGPSLGAENIARTLKSLIIGFVMVLIFMVVYYGGSGIVSIICLLLNLFFIFGALASLGTVLTLPGMAGIVLTIGMAVDANVIIYERIREELRAGKTIRLAVSDGFKNSYSAIIDANVTTILTAIVLAYFGLGPIKGFAVVLIIGVLSSLFTAVLIGRLLIEWWLSKDNRSISFWTGMSKNAFAHLNIDWLSKRKIAYIISGSIIVLGIGAMIMRGFEYGVDFKGGYSYNIQFEEGTAPPVGDLRTALATSLQSPPIVKAVDTRNTYNITTSYLINDTRDEAAAEVMEAVHQGVSSIIPGLSLDNFKNSDGVGTHITSSYKVGPTIADDIKSSSVYAAVFALILIFLYIFIRFSKWQYSMGAVAALFHDVLVVLGIFALFHGILPFSLEIDQAFIAALLTVIGYSINDTVVVFDRIREFMNDYTGKTKMEVINMAINSTVSRTVITSLTTLFVVAVLFFFGGSSIKGFAFALLIGIIVGTYSSIFVATPIMSDLVGDLEVKQRSKKSSFSRAKA